MFRYYRLSDLYADNILGCKLSQGALLQPSVTKTLPASVLTWQSEKIVLAIGRISGEVSILSETGNDWWKLSRLHKTSVTAIRWSSDGRLLLTGDKVSCMIARSSETGDDTWFSSIEHSETPYKIEDRKGVFTKAVVTASKSHCE